MAIVARAAIPGMGFDCSTKVSASQALQLVELGYTWCTRYVPLPSNGASRDIDDIELEVLTKVGLDVLLVQHVRVPPVYLMAHSAFADAMAAVDHARGARYPEGCHIFVDAEGIAPGTTADECKSYYERWGSQVLGEGFKAGIYVGYDVPMSAEELWLLHGINSYWKDPGPRVVANRGFAVRQLSPFNKHVAGLVLDEDEIVADLLGDTPMVATWV